MKQTKWHRNYIIRRYFYGPCLKLASFGLFLTSPLIPRGWYQMYRPIFIIGCSRSGTTVLIEHFRKHLDLCDWSEAAQILDLDFYNPGIDHLKGIAQVTAFERFRIRALFGLKARLRGKPRFINKHPENSLRIEFLKEIFPDALFIHMIREGMAAVESNYSRSQMDLFRSYYPFGDFPKPPHWRDYLDLPAHAQFAHQWQDIVNYIRQVAKKSLGPENYREIYYEDFCARPHELFRELDEFCGLNPARRLWHDIPEEFPNHNYKWRQKLAPAQIAEVEAIIGPLAEALGYGSSNTGQG
jgi:hypothetical protein